MVLTAAVRQQKHAEQLFSALGFSLRLKGKGSRMAGQGIDASIVRDLAIHMPV